MGKIQIIEKLLSYTLLFSFLLLPLAFIFSKAKRDSIVIILSGYGIFFFLFLFYFYDFPISFRKYQQAIYTFLEYSVFTFIFWSIVKQPKIKMLIIGLSALFLLFHIYYLFSRISGRMDTIPVGIETILILFYTFFYFSYILRHGRSLNIYAEPTFLLVVGILLYLGSSFFFNILVNHLSQEQVDNYWHLTYIPEIIKNILFSIAIIRYHNKYDNSKAKSTTIPNLDMV